MPSGKEKDNHGWLKNKYLRNQCYKKMVNTLRQAFSKFLKIILIKMR